MLTIGKFKKMVARAGREVGAREKEFSRLDAEAGGDGDHGTAIVAAFRAMQTVEGADFKSYLKSLSEALQSSACGSTSTLYGSWLEGMGEAVGEAVMELDAEGVAAMFSGGLEEIGFVTRAREGHKTLMDALIPATRVLSEAVKNADAGIAFSAAAEAAEAGAMATCAMQAKYGRAKNLGERSIGPRDAGAASMACIFNAFAHEAKLN